MYEELYAPLPDSAAYLERIGLADAQPEPTLAWLEQLVRAQLTHIPFDAMDVWGRGDCPSLAIEDLFDKIVRRHRGGYCYELNSLFCSFLKALGYDAYLVSVILVVGRDHIPPPAHCAIVCRIDGKKYFCDVGFGGPVPNGAVPFDGTVAHGYRVLEDGAFHVLEQVEGKEPGRIMLFHDVPVLPVELIPLNFHVSQREGSHFQQFLNVNLRYADGAASIFGRQFHFHAGDQRVERELTDLDDLKRVLETYFGIPGDDPPLRSLD